MATGRVPTTANSPLTAKGDLFGYSTTQARVAVGNDGETLVADSSTSTGLRYTANFAAGKNKIINGDFGVWQRGTTFNAIGSGAYCADRWTNTIGNTVNITQQTFTPGTAPVAGYESQYFIRYARTTSTANDWLAVQKVEDVRTFAGQTVTLSFWAKVSSGTLTPTNVYINQNFGSGGSGTVDATGFTPTFTTSWARYSYTVTLGSISGKTIGAGSFISTQMQFAPDKGTFTLDIWGFQLEAGSVATAFQTATGTIQGELAACRRYLPAVNLSGGVGCNLGYAYGTNAALFVIPFDTPSRVPATGITVPTITGNFTVRNNVNTDAGATTMTFDVSTINNASVLTNGTLTAGTVARLISNTNGGYILFTGCEL